MRSLLNVTPVRMKGVEAELRRIADCLEFFLAQEYGYNASAPVADTSGAEPEVLYTDQEQIDVLDALDRAGTPPEEAREQLKKLREAIAKGGL